MTPEKTTHELEQQRSEDFIEFFKEKYSAENLRKETAEIQKENEKLREDNHKRACRLNSIYAERIEILIEEIKILKRAVKPQEVYISDLKKIKKNPFSILKWFKNIYKNNH